MPFHVWARCFPYKNPLKQEGASRREVGDLWDAGLDFSNPSAELNRLAAVVTQPHLMLLCHP